MWPSTPMHWVVQFVLVWLVCLSTLAVAEPLSVDTVVKSIGSNAKIDLEGSTSTLQKRDNGTFLLRVLPLGASITMGYQSTDHNGYRKALRQQLRHAGWQVDMIGSLRNGTMHNNQHEGHYGNRIDQVETKIQATILQKPNLILINLGTNDADQNYQITTAGLRINTLLTTLYTAIPTTTIILSTLLPNKKHPDQVHQISSQYRDLVALRRRQGYRIVLADMSTFIKLSQLVDGTHPDDYGYTEMAAVWWAAFLEAEAEGFLEFADGTGADGRISASEEAELDGGDSIGDPGLPTYTAPAQPGATDATDASESAKSVVNSGGVRGIGLAAVQAFAVGIGLSLYLW